jgi:ATP-dependent helicase Lhr and Lhr-like helicase
MGSSAFSLLDEGVQRAIHRLGWKELRPIQAEGIRTILGSEDDLIVSAPTAGGKTEAAFLPIVSALVSDPAKIAIYVSPLKALINDQWNRLDYLCTDLDVPARRWHGDISATEKKDFRENPRGVLLITPESLESNFVNYGRALPRVYAKTAFVVIDELHVFVDGVRGMHLRSLISRLCAAAGCTPRLIGLSATLGDPMAAQRFLRPDDPSRVRLVIESGSGRDVRLGIRGFLERPRFQTGDQLVRRLMTDEAGRVCSSVIGDGWRSDAPLADLGPDLSLRPLEENSVSRDALDEIADDVSAHFQAGTNLVFGNSRRTLEELADVLHERAREAKWPHDPFCVHHGSLSKSTREEVEERLRSKVPTTALCTSTLELGIDIGNVRTVGQIDPPWSVAALVQRLGRSGRRAGEPARLRLYARDETPHTDSTLSDLLFPRLLRSIALCELMLEKWMEPNSSERMHLSTMVHQLLSVLRQTGGLTAQELQRILCLAGPFRAVGSSFFSRLLRALAERDIIEQIPTGELILALTGERITEGHDFYAAFVSNEIFVIRYADEIVGEMPADTVPPVGQYFILSGRRWEITDIAPREKMVWVRPTRERVPPLFAGEGGDIDGRIFDRMRTLLVSESMPAYLDHGARVLLNSARHAAHESGAAQSGIIFADKSVIWYPWTGTKAFRTLRLMLDFLDVPHGYDSLSIRLPDHDRERFEQLQRRLSAQPFDPIELAAKMEVKAFDKFDELLSSDLLDEMNARDRLDLPGAKAAVSRLREFMNS